MNFEHTKINYKEMLWLEPFSAYVSVLDIMSIKINKKYSLEITMIGNILIESKEFKTYDEAKDALLIIVKNIQSNQ